MLNERLLFTLATTIFFSTPSANAEEFTNSRLWDFHHFGHSLYSRGLIYDPRIQCLSEPDENTISKMPVPGGCNSISNTGEACTSILLRTLQPNPEESDLDSLKEAASLYESYATEVGVDSIPIFIYGLGENILSAKDQTTALFKFSDSLGLQVSRGIAAEVGGLVEGFILSKAYVGIQPETIEVPFSRIVSTLSQCYGSSIENESTNIGDCYEAGRALASHIFNERKWNYFERYGADPFVCHRVAFSAWQFVREYAPNSGIAPSGITDVVGQVGKYGQWWTEQAASDDGGIRVFEAMTAFRLPDPSATGWIKAQCRSTSDRSSVTVRMYFVKDSKPAGLDIVEGVFRFLSGQVSLTSEGSEDFFAVQMYDLPSSEGEFVVASDDEVGFLRFIQDSEGTGDVLISFDDVDGELEDLKGIVGTAGAKRAIATAMAACLPSDN